MLLILHGPGLTVRTEREACMAAARTWWISGQVVYVARLYGELAHGAGVWRAQREAPVSPHRMLFAYGGPVRPVRGLPQLYLTPVPGDRCWLWHGDRVVEGRVAAIAQDADHPQLTYTVPGQPEPVTHSSPTPLFLPA